MRILLVVVGMTLLTGLAFGQGSERYSGPIIDMHLHAYTDEEFWGPAPNPATGEMSVDNAEHHYLESMALLKKHNIVMAVIDGESLDAVEPWEQMLGDAAVITASRDADQPLDRYEELVSEEAIELFGEIGAAYQGRSPSHFTLMPYYAIAEKYEIPVAIHTGGSFPGITRQNPDFRLRLGDPLLLEDMLVAHPDLRVYMMHAGTHFYHRAVVMMVQYPALYVDVAVLNWIPDANNFLEPFLRMAKEHDVLDRVMYGSDQMIWPEAIEMGIETIQSLEFLTQEDKKGIFYDNAARFLKLSQEEIAQHRGAIE